MTIIAKVNTPKELQQELAVWANDYAVNLGVQLRISNTAKHKAQIQAKIDMMNFVARFILELEIETTNEI